MNWDIVLALAQGFLTVFLLPTVLAFDLQVGIMKTITARKYLGWKLTFGKKVYVPRITSGTTAAGLFVIALALYNLGIPMGASVAFVCALLWTFIFFKRGTEGGS